MTHVLITVLEFSDSTFQARALYTGTHDACRKLMDSIPGVSYSGEKLVTDSYLRIITEEQWREAVTITIEEAKADTAGSA